MTQPPGPHGPNPFAHNPFDTSAAGHPAPPPYAAPPPDPRGEANTLATLSLVFAFVFAPAGAILGHLGLSQIAHTRQRGRDRALIGVTLSYAFITAAVVSLVVWAALGDTSPAQTAAPATTTATAAPTLTTTTTPPPPPPPPPTVAPTDLAGLLPSAQETGSLTGLSGVYADETDTELGGFPKKSTFDPPNCETTHSVGSPRVYDAAALTGFRLVAYSGNNYMHSAQSVAAYPDNGAARAALERMLANWRTCGGTTIVWAGVGSPNDTRLEPPFDAGNGITAMRLYPVARGLPGERASLSHAIAVKSNILVDVMVFSGENGADNTHEAIALANFTLGKIPG